MKKTKSVPVIIAVVVLALVAVVVIGPKVMKKNKPAMSVPLSAVEKGTLEDRVSAAGSFQAERYTVVSSQTVGIVKEVHVKPGDHVSKNDIIILVDERESREALSSAEIALEETRRSLSLELSSLRAQIRSATTELDQAIRAADGADRLRTVNGISEEEARKAYEQRDSVRLSLADLREKLRMEEGLPAGEVPSFDPALDMKTIENSPAFRKAALDTDSARRALEGCVIRAGGTGTLTEIYVAVGDRLTVTTTQVARIEEPSSVIAEVNVDEVDIGKIHEGLPAEITADSMLGKTINGHVERIWPIVKSDGAGRVCKVHIGFDTADKKILSGASCMARISSVLKKDALIIPASALIPGAKPTAVWLAEELVPAAKDGVKADGAKADGAKPDSAKLDAKKKAEPAKQYKAVRCEITIGASTVSNLEVVSGLQAGDLVAIDKIALITDGMTMQNGSVGK